MPLFNNTPAHINVNNNAGQASAAVSWSEPTVTDNSGFYTLTVDHQSGTGFDIGSTIVTYKAIDASGNIASFTFIVTVEGMFDS